MNWLNDKISIIQKMVFKEKKETFAEDTTVDQITRQRTVQRVQRFQSRLMDLDRRLAELR